MIKKPVLWFLLVAFIASPGAVAQAAQSEDVKKAIETLNESQKAILKEIAGDP
jgi:hypothetical protein